MLSIDFQTGDAEHLPFEANTFDVVVSRNLVWTLPAPETAMREWHRVLKPGPHYHFRRILAKSDLVPDSSSDH